MEPVWTGFMGFWTSLNQYNKLELVWKIWNCIQAQDSFIWNQCEQILNSFELFEPVYIDLNCIEPVTFFWPILTWLIRLEPVCSVLSQVYQVELVWVNSNQIWTSVNQFEAVKSSLNPFEKKFCSVWISLNGFDPALEYLNQYELGLKSMNGCELMFIN